MANSSTWNEPEARPQLVDVHDESVERIAIPYADETVTGLGTIDDTLVAVTHGGHVLGVTDMNGPNLQQFRCLEM
jgi:hypothetical protein